jgi:hypothetical protein
MGGNRGRLGVKWAVLACAVTVALAAGGALAGSASAYIYVGNGSHIVRANDDGTGVDPAFITVDGFVCGVAVDSTHIYWTDLNSVGRADLDGTNVQQDLFTIADPAKSFCGVALDSSHVYWVERHLNNIGRADLDGGNPQASLFTAASQPCGVAVDGTYVYFAPNASGPITRFPKDGGAPVAMGWATGNAACSIAVSDKAVYYADHNASGATPIHAASTTSMSVLADVPGATGPCGIAVTASGLYWANDPTAGGSVGTVAVGSDGGAVGSPNQSLLTGLSGPCGVAVDSLPLPPGGGSSSPGGGSSSPGGSTAPSNVFKLDKLTAGKGSVTLTVSVPGPGELTAEDNATAKKTGAAAKKKTLIQKAKATATKAGTVKLKVKPSSAGKVVLKKKGKLKVTVKVTFTPKGGKAASKNVKVTLKEKK